MLARSCRSATRAVAGSSWALARAASSVAVADLEGELGKFTKSAKLQKWIRESVALCKPDRVHLLDGSEEEDAELKRQMVHNGTLIQLNPEKRPNSYLARSSPKDVARVEQCTFICSNDEADAGPTNNWADPKEMQARLDTLFDGSMKGRTMYVAPYSMGPIGGASSKSGVQITDSAYAVVNVRIMTRMGKQALAKIDEEDRFTPALHSVGEPLTEAGTPDSAWPCSDEKLITHFTDAEEPHIISYGSGYGGNAILGKKCHALRIASVQARNEGWMAEHMLILRLTSPEGEVKHIAGCFPSACGKTNLAMLSPDLPGWKVECVGDDIAWLRPGPDGRLWATNPESGFFGVAPGTSAKTNPNAMDSLHANCIFTNVALTDDGDIWWEGMTKEAPERATSWLRRDWRPDTDMGAAAHPNSRFTAPASQCPIIASNWEDPAGVPIDAFLMGGRRATTVPLVAQALSWEHGVYMGATMLSQTTAAAEGKPGELRSDPFAMKPFIGYNVGDYLQHWLDMGTSAAEGGKNLPKMFFVNWFRQENGTGGFVWPGFGSNSRVLEWVFHRCNAGDAPDARTNTTAVGHVPDAKTGLDVSGLDVTPEAMEEILTVDKAAWERDLHLHKETLDGFGDRVPAAVREQYEALKSRVTSA